MMDLSTAQVVSPPQMSGPEQKAVAMLVEEVERRSTIRWICGEAWPRDPLPVIAVGRVEALKTFAEIRPDLVGPGTKAAEGYKVRARKGERAPIVIVAGNDSRGVLFGVGRLLRSLHCRRGAVCLKDRLDISTAPRYKLRGHQLGYRDKTNSYCGWDLRQWEQYIRDLVVFGTNAIELIPPRSDDEADSVHFPLPPLDTMEGMSRIADEYGIDVWIWFPAMDRDYGNQETVESAIREWAEVFRRLPRIDAVFVPGGDPGRARPRVLMSLLEKQKASLQGYHPRAQIWVSPQGFPDEWMEDFVGILREGPDWLDGVVFGPMIHMSTAEFREMIPGKYPIRHYPDITHSLSCQYPVPGWDVAYALTEGREVINPRPRGHATIFRYTQPPTIGFLTYSEGCNDDVNKIVWSSLGWDPEADIVEVLREYARYFIGDRYADDFAQGLLALERNWEGPLIGNAGVYATLQQFQGMEKSASPRDLKNWRFQQALYRAYYDAYVRSRLVFEKGLEEEAMAQLRQAPAKGSLLAMGEAERVLDRARTEGISRDWRTRVFQLAEALFQSIHMKLSVGLYRAQSEDRGASLDGIDFPLNDGPWLKARFAEVRALPEEGKRLEAIRGMVERTDPGPGGFYDNLGSSYVHPHMVSGKGFEDDPGFWRTPFRHYPHWKNPNPLPLAWRGCTGTLKDVPFEMRYSGLDPDASYRVRVVYSELNRDIKVRLQAKDGIEIHPFMPREGAPCPMEFDIPREATRGGELLLRWQREPGKGGTGRGCQVSEIWLLKKAGKGGD